MTRFGTRPLLLAATAALSVAACSGSSKPADVRVGLKDFAVTVSTASVPSGDTTFSISNEGPSIHEVEVFKVPEGVDVAALLVSAGVADTDGPGLTLVDEVEDIAPSTTGTLKVKLDPGRYALICNLPAHYEQGMFATLDVK